MTVQRSIKMTVLVAAMSFSVAAMASGAVVASVTEAARAAQCDKLPPKADKLACYQKVREETAAAVTGIPQGPASAPQAK